MLLNKKRNHLENTPRTISIDTAIDGVNELNDSLAESINGGLTVICYNEAGEEIGSSSTTTNGIIFTTNGTTTVEYVTAPGSEIQVRIDGNIDGNPDWSSIRFNPGEGDEYRVPAPYAGRRVRMRVTEFPS